MSKIEGKEFILAQVFSDSFDYYIPMYQRPYSWNEEQAEKLFDDLHDSYQTQSFDNYFLGSIVLIKEDDKKPHSDVIDGQQRLITLTILFAAIAAFLENEYQSTVYKYICSPGDLSLNIKPAPRLHIRDKDELFFNNNIQNILHNKLKFNEMETFTQSTNTLDSDSQEHIRSNCKVLFNRIKDTFKGDKDQIFKFFQFMATKCYIIVVWTDDRNNAFRIFSVINSRGLDLTAADIIKSDVVGSISSQSKQKLYADKWEDLEIDVGRNGFNEVFSQTRMIFAKKKAQKSLVDEFNEYVTLKMKPEYLIDNIIEPYAKALIDLRKCSYTSTNNNCDQEINKLLDWLKKINFADWIAPAMKFLAEKNNDSAYVLWFIQQLERLTAYLHITAKDVNKRIDRYKLLLEEMEQNPKHNIKNKLTTIELTDTEKTEFLKVLNQNIYDVMTAQRRNYLILRLDSFVSCGGAATYNPKILTIEHVLPQTVDDNSQWSKWWSDVNERAYWLHRVANLIPLTRRKNSAAQNYDFNKKKKAYFQNKGGTTSYPLTTQIINESVWTPDVVKKRQEYLIGEFKTNWNLQVI